MANQATPAMSPPISMYRDVQGHKRAAVQLCGTNYNMLGLFFSVMPQFRGGVPVELRFDIDGRKITAREGDWIVMGFPPAPLLMVLPTADFENSFRPDEET